MKNDLILSKILKNNKYLLFEYLRLKDIRYDVNFEETSLRMDSFKSNNYNGLSLSLEKMIYYDFKNSLKGSVLDMLHKICNKPKIEILLEFKDIIYNNKYNINPIDEEDFQENVIKEIPNYPINLLNLYPQTISDLFLEDGIDEKTQAIFEIKYDIDSDRVLIPVKFKNNLVGIIGRFNNKIVPKGVAKYLPLLAYPKSEILFGYDLCNSTIRKSKKVILVESEKSVMKSIQLGLFNTLAIGGSFISNSQIKLLSELEVKDVYICFDSDKNLEELKEYILKQFKNTEFNVYIIDNNTKYINEKSCLFDMKFKFKVFKNYFNKFKVEIYKGGKSE